MRGKAREAPRRGRGVQGGQRPPLVHTPLAMHTVKPPPQKEKQLFRAKAPWSRGTTRPRGEQGNRRAKPTCAVMKRPNGPAGVIVGDDRAGVRAAAAGASTAKNKQTRKRQEPEKEKHRKSGYGPETPK